MKKFIIIIFILAVIAAVFYAFKDSIYQDRDADATAGETASRSGRVLAVDLTQIALDGPYLITLESSGNESVRVAVPSMGLPLCVAYQNGDIRDVSTIEVGETLEVRGKVGEDGSIVPCESSDHYLRVESSSNSSSSNTVIQELTLEGKTWVWDHALYNDGRQVRPRNPGSFTLTFEGDNFSAKTDCNGIGGDYTADNSGISFTNMISTLMYCENSQENDFRQLLTNTNSYHFTPSGELVLDLKFDSGSVVFK